MKKEIGKSSSKTSIKKIIKDELKPVLKKLERIEKDIKEIKKRI